MNLQQEDRNDLYACKSDADWAEALAAIKARHRGSLPDDWHIQMIVGGLEASLRESWPKPPAPIELTVDPERLADIQSGDPYWASPTGIFVRAKHEGKWDGHDIAVLDKASLLEFLRKDGGDNIWAENVVGALLGHVGPLHGG